MRATVSIGTPMMPPPTSTFTLVASWLTIRPVSEPASLRNTWSARSACGTNRRSSGAFRIGSEMLHGLPPDELGHPLIAGRAARRDDLQMRFLLAAFLAAGTVYAAPIHVRFVEGLTRGYML